MTASQMAAIIRKKSRPELQEESMAWGARVRILIQRLLLAGFASLSAMPFGAARADYPDRQITIIVCFPTGGGADIAARLIGTAVGDALGGSVIIESRGGAGGNIGITAAMRSPADGYTLLVCSSAFVVNPSLYAQASYDPFKDFE